MGNPQLGLSMWIPLIRYDSTRLWASDVVFRDRDNYPANLPALGNTTDDINSLLTGSSTPAAVPSSTEGSASQSADDQGKNSDALPAFIEH
ncbi:hypothetical protein LIER_31853 [Lithospermum erythrorhizon]|uniref:Uncharacterized protein n=1 Tax=Lithospermum erythrorhizon TaxID=34254 RepID=A0AAV3RVQ8_LITER